MQAKIPNAQKRQSSHQCPFVLLGPTHVKDLSKIAFFFLKESISAKFYKQFLSNILLTKNYKAKLLSEKSCAKHFRKKKSKILIKLTPVLLGIFLEKDYQRKSWCQFQQLFTSSIFVWKCFEQLFYAYTLSLYFYRKKLATKLLVKRWWNWLLYSPRLCQ